MKSGLVMQGSCEKCEKSKKNYYNLLVLLWKFKIYGFMVINTSFYMDFTSRRIILAQIIVSKYSSRQISFLCLLYKEGKRNRASGTYCSKLNIGEDRENFRPNRDIIQAGYAEKRNSNLQKDPACI